MWAETDSLDTTFLDVLTHPSIPLIGSSHPDYAAAKLQKRAAKQDDENPYIWEVRLTYGTRGQTEQEESDPLQEPVKLSFSFRKLSVIPTVTIDGFGLVNSAGDPFEGLQIDQSRPVLTFKKNVASFSPTQVLTYADAINSDSFRGFAPYTCKIEAISGEETFDRGTRYWAMSYVIEVNYQTWKLQVVDAGFRELIDAGPPARHQEILDDYAQRVAKPVHLDGAGRKLPHGEQPNVIEFRVYRELPFGPLGLT
jgi:hypothetical protein